jgi:geranylgeranyl reductase family protein
MYDVVVVGAGPAGSTAAKFLSEEGLNVLLVDKEKFPRDKPCGGGLPTRVLRRFPYIEDLIDSISYGSLTYSSSLKYKFKVERDKPLVFTVIRRDFDNGLLSLAKEKGVDLLLGRPVVNLRIEKDMASITLEDGEEIESKIVVGADGIKSVVAEKADLGGRNKRCICMVQEQEMTEKELDRYFSEKRIIHIFIKTQGIAGYGWVFPKKKHVNIGVGIFTSAIKSAKTTNLKRAYEMHVRLLKDMGLLPQTFKIENLKGCTLPLFPLQKTYSDRVLLCGDAAGFINPITGEGIYYAMASGEIAASVIKEALSKKDTSERMLSKFQKEWRKDFGRDLELLARFNDQWGKESEKIVKLLTKDEKLAKLVIGVTGGQISISKYKLLLLTRYIYVNLKDFLSSSGAVNLRF